MSCNSIALAGINIGCKDHMGGIKEVYLIKADDITVNFDIEIPVARFVADITLELFYARVHNTHHLIIRLFSNS